MRVDVTIEIPGGPGGVVGPAYQLAMQNALEQATAKMVNVVIQATQYSSVASKYGIAELIGPMGARGVGGVNILNTSSAWYWVEHGAKAVSPPWGPDSRLDFWADNPYMAAKKIKAVGFTSPNAGLFDRTFTAYMPSIRAAVSQASAAFIRAALTPSKVIST